jgi:hypothetical protein
MTRPGGPPPDELLLRAACVRIADWFGLCGDFPEGVPARTLAATVAERFGIPLEHVRWGICRLRELGLLALIPPADHSDSWMWGRVIRRGQPTVRVIRLDEAQLRPEPALQSWRRLQEESPPPPPPAAPSQEGRVMPDYRSLIAASDNLVAFVDATPGSGPNGLLSPGEEERLRRLDEAFGAALIASGLRMPEISFPQQGAKDGFLFSRLPFSRNTLGMKVWATPDWRSAMRGVVAAAERRAGLAARPEPVAEGAENAGATMPSPTPQSILQEVEAVRARVCREMEEATRGPRGGNSPRGVQLDGVEAGLDWVQGRIDADFQLPKLYPYIAQLRLLKLDNVPAWQGEPQDELKTLEILDQIIECCRRALNTPPPAAPEPAEARAASTTPPAELTAVERALVIYSRDPDQSVREVARRAGCDPSLLYRDERFGRLREAYKRKLRKGTKSKEGDLEAEA